MNLRPPGIVAAALFFQDWPLDITAMQRLEFLHPPTRVTCRFCVTDLSFFLGEFEAFDYRKTPIFRRTLTHYVKPARHALKAPMLEVRSIPLHRPGRCNWLQFSKALQRRWFHVFDKIVPIFFFGDKSKTLIASSDRERDHVVAEAGSREFALRCGPVYLLTKTKLYVPMRIRRRMPPLNPWDCRDYE